MHEASIIMGVIDTVTEQCHREGYTGISSIRLRIGKAAQLLPDALRFAFEIARQDTLAAAAELIIETVPLGGTCQACGHAFELELAGLAFCCPACQATDLKIDRGFELEIVDMEVDNV